MSDSHTVNTASPDALIEVDTTSHKSSKSIEPPNKKPRFDRSKTHRHGGVAYQKLLPTSSLTIVPRCSHFPIFTSNLGCKQLSTYTYTAIQGRDFRLAASISQLQLEYALTIAYCNRISQTAIHFGYAFPINASRLKQIATGIQLPTILAQYIEAIGTVELSSGVSVVPHADNYDQMFNDSTRLLMLDPACILREAQRPVPDGDWALDTSWIVEYNSATTRASRSGMKFRTVDNSDLKGRIEMITSWTTDREDGYILPMAPQLMTEAEIQLGAMYNYRCYDDIERWLGQNKQLAFNACIGIPFLPMVAFSDICVAAFKGAMLSNE